MALESFVLLKCNMTSILILLKPSLYIYRLPTDPSLSHELHLTMMNLEGRVGLNPSIRPGVAS
jgi:hypothetical protein